MWSFRVVCHILCLWVYKEFNLPVLCLHYADANVQDRAEQFMLGVRRRGRADYPQSVPPRITPFALCINQRICQCETWMRVFRSSFALFIQSQGLTAWSISTLYEGHQYVRRLQFPNVNLDRLEKQILIKDFAKNFEVLNHFAFSNFRNIGVFPKNQPLCKWTKAIIHRINMLLLWQLRISEIGKFPITAICVTCICLCPRITKIWQICMHYCNVNPIH